MRTITLVVGGMHDRRRIREVSARLRDVEGVQTVSVDVDAARIRLTGTMTSDEVRLALAGLDDPLRLLGETSGPD